MSVSFGTSLCHGAGEYFGMINGKYAFCQLAGRIVPLFTPSESLSLVTKFSDIFMDVSEGIDIVPTTIAALPNLWTSCEKVPGQAKLLVQSNFAQALRKGQVAQTVKISSEIIQQTMSGISQIRAEDALNAVSTVSILAVQVFSTIALVGALRVADLGRLAAQMGSMTLSGYHPMMPFVAVPLIPALQACYIIYLTSDIALKVLHNRAAPSAKKLQTRYLNLTKQTCDTEDKWKKKTEKIEKTINTELTVSNNFCDIIKDATIIAFQGSVLFSLASPPALITLGIISASTTVLVGVMESKSMQDWFKQRFTEEALK